MPYRLLSPATAAAVPVATIGAPLVSVGDTLLGMTDELLLQLASRGDATLVRRKKWINWAYRSLAASIKLKELYGSVSFTLAVNQPFYLIPVQLATINRVSVIDTDTYYVTGGRKLISIDEEQYAKLPNEDAEPTHYFREGRMLVLWPDPLTIRSLPVRGRIRPDDMTADNHSPLLPSELHEPILLLARHRAFRSLQDRINAQIAKNDYIDAISPLISTDGEEQAETPSGVSFIKDPRDLVRTSLRENIDD